MDSIKKPFGYIKSFAKWIVLALLVGVVGGGVGAVFHLCIDRATELRTEFSNLIFLLPIGGLAICGLYKLSKVKLDTNRVIESVRGRKEIPFIMAPFIFVSTVITHLLGGSAGREGAALQLGGSIGYNTGKLFRLSENDMHTIVMAGMSAVFAALFGTPLTAIFFSLEVTSVGIMYYSGLLPCIISAFSAVTVAKLCNLGTEVRSNDEGCTCKDTSSCSLGVENCACAYIRIKILFLDLLSDGFDNVESAGSAHRNLKNGNAAVHNSAGTNHCVLFGLVTNDTYKAVRMHIS